MPCIATAIYADLIAGLDEAAFTAALRPFWNPFAGAGAAKYLAVEVWLREAVFRYLLCTAGLKQTGPVVDLGSGTGYFLWVCREHGHKILGIDIEGEPLYDACCSFLGIPRVEYRIEPHKALSDTGHELCMVTAFMTCFDRFEDGRPWDVDAWRFFLADVRTRLKSDGRLVIKFNAQADTGDLYSPDVHRVFGSTNDYRFRPFLDYAILTAR